MDRSQATAVVIAACNAGSTISRAIASALVQPETAEVCIVDDGSQDDTRAEAEAWAARDARVIVLSQANAGPAAARNAAIAATRSPWIALLDADDYWLPGRLTALHGQAKNADCVADALIRVADGAEPTAVPIGTSCQQQCLTLEDFLLGNLGKRDGPLDLGYLKPLMRRAFLDTHGLRYRSELRLGEDFDLYARALTLGARFLLTSPAGYVSVERANSLSKNHGEVDLQQLRDCGAGFAVLRPLTRSEQRALRRHYTSVDCRLQWLRLIHAVKAKDVPAALSAFRSPSVAVYLATRLCEQLWVRSTASLRAAIPLGPSPLRA